jgi:hypothetical protein
MVLLIISNYINSIDPEITADAQSWVVGSR